MTVTDAPLVGFYNLQRFKQYDPSDTANWYLVPDDIGKKKVAMYPTMGRQHINYLGRNQLIFDAESRLLDKSINYWYNIIDDKIYRIDKFFNSVEITAGIKLSTINGDINMTFIVVNANSGGSGLGVTLVCFADGQHFYLYREETNEFGIVTDSHLPLNPIYLAAFGNRIVCSTLNSSAFGLSEINLNYNTSFATILSTCFTINGSAVFAQEAGIIRQMAVLQNTLYMFTDYTTGIWSNIPSTFISAGGIQTAFPFKKNTTYDWDFGIADPNSLDVDFGMMVWEAQNRNGLVQFMVSTGQKPEPISTKAIDVLLQNIANSSELNPFLNPADPEFSADGFLYDYENTIFYRVSAGQYTGTGLVDQVSTANSIEFNFDTKTWHRCIEMNGERNRIQQHVFFNNQHLVSVQGDNTVYEMSGQFYTNEIRNQSESDPQASDAYLVLPFRYERVTPIICMGTIDLFKGMPYYGEFITDYLEIDFCWGLGTFINSDAPFDNAVFIIDEQAATDSTPQYMITENDSNNETFIISEQGNYPVANSPTYNNWFKPSIELLFSDDGGISFKSADVREFSQIGVYLWRMRWYQLGASRLRVYKLICTSPAPLVILGANMDVRRASGGAA